MATRRLEIPVELFAQLEAKAETEGKTVDELALQALLSLYLPKNLKAGFCPGIGYSCDGVRA